LNELREFCAAAKNVYAQNSIFAAHSLLFQYSLFKKMPDQKAFIATMKMCESFQVEADPLLLLRACLK